MKITLNNRPEEFELNEMSVEKMLEIRKFSFKMRIVKINGVLIKKEKYSTAVIREGDNVQMLYLMSGG
ncbi:MAG: sulfur carrier protein ThiS [Bacteroidales bacterium]|nr:sulfur carrier protein ThiS [Bacteroidales bacterium]